MKVIGPSGCPCYPARVGNQQCAQRDTKGCVRVVALVAKHAQQGAPRRTSSTSRTDDSGRPPPRIRSRSTRPMDTSVWPCRPGRVPMSACASRGARGQAPDRDIPSSTDRSLTRSACPAEGAHGLAVVYEAPQAERLSSLLPSPGPHEQGSGMIISLLHYIIRRRNAGQLRVLCEIGLGSKRLFL